MQPCPFIKQEATSDIEGNEWVNDTMKKIKVSSPIFLNMTQKSVIYFFPTIYCIFKFHSMICSE